MNRPTEEQGKPVWQRALGILGIVLHLGVGYFYLTAGLVTPWPWLIAFLVAWVVLLVVGIGQLRVRPLWVLLIPVVALGILVVGVSLGGVLLGWTA